jgi:two-component system nitrogen regulation response regulator NtrX
MTADIRLLISGISATKASRPARRGNTALSLWPPTQPHHPRHLAQQFHPRRHGPARVLKVEFPEVPVIMISGHGNIETAVTAIKNGAYDFIEAIQIGPPADHQRALEAARLRRRSRLKHRAGGEGDYRFLPGHPAIAPRH